MSLFCGKKPYLARAKVIKFVKTQGLRYAKEQARKQIFKAKNDKSNEALWLEIWAKT